MAHLRKKGKYYYAEFNDSSRRPQRKWIPLRTKDKQTAQQRLVALEREYAMGVRDPWDMKPDQAGLLVNDATEQFLRSRKGRSEKTVENYRLVLSLFNRTLSPDFQLEHVEARHIEAFLDGQDLNETSRGTYFRHLRVFFRWTLKDGLLKENPMSRMETPRSAKTVAKFLTPKQVDKLVRYIEKDVEKKGGYVHEGQVTWLIDIIHFAVCTGLRLGEICNLRWSAVDLDSGFLTVRNTEEFRTKSGHERSIPIAGEAVKVLTRLAEERGDEKDGYVFTTPSGKQWDIKYVSRRFRYYREKAGLPDGIRFHSLRHTCASWLVMRGVSLSVVQAMLGHSSIQVTQRYAHLAPKTFKNEIERAFGERNEIKEPLRWAA